MKRFYTAIVRRRRLVLAVFALAAVLSMAATSRVQVDYDINDYLPPESPSTTAIEVMNGAFTGGIPNMRVMVRDVTVPQALEYKEKLAAIVAKGQNTKVILGDLLERGDHVVLVTPIDSSAPKGRMILPQVQAIRDILDAGATCSVTQVEELAGVLNDLKTPPKLVVTDSQAFGKVKQIVPESIKLTSFSILFARYKGVLETAVRGAAAIESLKAGDRILISEGCTHHRQCGDIGTVKLPAWIRKHTGKDFEFEFTSGGGFPEDLSPYALIVHCGGCMLNEREMQFRQSSAEEKGVPYTNYGILIAYINGILKRSLAPFDEYASMI